MALHVIDVHRLHDFKEISHDCRPQSWECLAHDADHLARMLEAVHHDHLAERVGLARAASTLIDDEASGQGHGEAVLHVHPG